MSLGFRVSLSFHDRLREVIRPPQRNASTCCNSELNGLSELIRGESRGHLAYDHTRIQPSFTPGAIMLYTAVYSYDFSILFLSFGASCQGALLAFARTPCPLSVRVITHCCGVSQSLLPQVKSLETLWCRLRLADEGRRVYLPDTEVLFLSVTRCGCLDAIRVNVRCARPIAVWHRFFFPPRWGKRRCVVGPCLVPGIRV